MKASPLGVAKRGALSVLGRIAALGIVVAIAGGCEGALVVERRPAGDSAAVSPFYNDVNVKVSRIKVGECWYVLVQDRPSGVLSTVHAADCPNHYQPNAAVKVSPPRSAR